jgi:hypothetical protein
VLFVVIASEWRSVGAAVHPSCGTGHISLSCGCDLSFVVERQTNQEDVKMKLTLKKAALVHLSKDEQMLPAELTPQIGGGQNVDVNSSYVTYNCPVETAACWEPPTRPHTLCTGSGNHHCY